MSIVALNINHETKRKPHTRTQVRFPLLILAPMIAFEEFVLDNGLQVIVHEDPSVQIAVMNILYDVGSRDENPNKTGFAHLFEHLMFGGSKNIPTYDEPLQVV